MIRLDLTPRMQGALRVKSDPLISLTSSGARRGGGLMDPRPTPQGDTPPLTEDGARGDGGGLSSKRWRASCRWMQAVVEP